MARRYAIAVLAVVFVIAACGGSGDDGTTIPGSDDPTSTTGAVLETTSPDGDGPSIGIDDIPQECIDAFVGYLHAIEPILADFDFANATLADLEEVSTAIGAETGDFEDVAPGCEDLNVDASDEESFEFMLDLARDEAPGTVPYFEMLRDFIDSGDGTGDGAGAEASGDCETDIAAMQAIIDQGVAFQDLPFSEIATVGNLTTSIGLNCSQERSAEFYSQEDVAAFLAG